MRADRVTAGMEEHVRNAFGATITLIAVVLPLAAQTTVTGTVTVPAGQSLNLDTGTTSVTSGDIYWSPHNPESNSSGIAPLGTSGNAVIAYPPASVTAANFSSITLAQLLSYDYVYYADNAPGPVFAVHTNENNYAAVLVTAVAGDNSTITLQFITFHSPTISQVLNNYSQVGPGFPNAGIALGSLFIVKGGTLASATSAVLASSAAPGLPTTLNGASVSVTVNGTTVTPAFYYAINTQLALVMPSNTPIGSGTITVKYNGVTSPAFNIEVVASALGFAGYYGYGTGLGIATDPGTGAFYNYMNSIPPGATVVLWGSGLGADPTRDTTFVTPTGGFAINGLAALYVGGVEATIQYQGASGYPGVNQLNAMIPANVPTGCHVPVVGVTAAGVPTNFITVPIGTGICEEPEWGRNGTMLSSLAAQTTVNTFLLGLNLPLDANGNVQPHVNVNLPIDFYSYTGGGFGTASGVVSSGGCIANSTLYASATEPLLSPNIIVPQVGDLTITPLNPVAGAYQLPPGSVGPGGTLTFEAETSAQGGGFTTTVTLPTPTLNWTNQDAASTIDRAGGLNVTWSGGQAGTYVYITGKTTGTGGGGSFTCIAPVSAKQFTVPPYVFAALPGETATITVGDQTIPQTFQGEQIDYGYTQGSDSQSVSATLQ